MLPDRLTTADLPSSFRPDPIEQAVRKAATARGIRLTDCIHGRGDCGECLRALGEAVREASSPAA